MQRQPSCAGTTHKNNKSKNQTYQKHLFLVWSLSSSTNMERMGSMMCNTSASHQGGDSDVMSSVFIRMMMDTSDQIKSCVLSATPSQLLSEHRDACRTRASNQTLCFCINKQRISSSADQTPLTPLLREMFAPSWKWLTLKTRTENLNCDS